LNVENMHKLIAKEPITAKLATEAITGLGKKFLPNPFIRKPTNGNKGINQTKSIILLYKNYHFNLLRILISIELVLRYTITIIAKPMATSAAARAIIKNTNTCPDASPL